MQIYNTTNLLSIIEGSIEKFNISDINKQAILAIVAENFRNSVGGSEFLSDEINIGKTTDVDRQKYEFSTFYTPRISTFEIIDEDGLIISMYLNGEYYVVRLNKDGLTTEETDDITYLRSAVTIDKDEIDEINLFRYNGNFNTIKHYKVKPVGVRQGDSEYFLLIDKEAGESFKERLKSSELIRVNSSHMGVDIIPYVLEEATKTIDNKLNKDNKVKGLHRK